MIKELVGREKIVWKTVADKVNEIIRLLNQAEEEELKEEQERKEQEENKK